MAHLTADAMTTNFAPAIHAGLNAQICKFSFGGTSSGSLTVALTPLPAGAEVVAVNHYMSNNGVGTGGELVSIFANIGGQTTSVSAQYSFMASATIGTNTVANVGKDFGNRLTASANVFASYTNQVGTGTSTVDVTVIIEYLHHKRGD